MTFDWFFTEKFVKVIAIPTILFKNRGGINHDG